MSWDDAAQRPVSQEGLSFKAALASLDFEWCIDMPSSVNGPASALDLDNLSLPSFQTAGAAVPSLIHNAGPVTVTHSCAPLQNASVLDSDDLTAASTIDSRVSVLESGLKKIFEKLELLTTPGAHPSTGSGSTSTPSEAPNLGLATANPGPRD